HHQFALAIEAMTESREALPADDTRRLEFGYRIAEDQMAMEHEDKAVEEYRTLVQSPLKHNFYRLSALAKLGEYYEGKEMWNEALQAYDDLARNSSRDDWS